MNPYKKLNELYSRLKVSKDKVNDNEIKYAINILYKGLLAKKVSSDELKRKLQSIVIV